MKLFGSVVGKPDADTRVGPHVILPSDVRTKIAKRAAYLMLLIPLVLFEMYLCTAFLPMRWQRAINDSLPAAVHAKEIYLSRHNRG
jgi:hypothetical protein